MCKKLQNKPSKAHKGYFVFNHRMADKESFGSNEQRLLGMKPSLREQHHQNLCYVVANGFAFQKRAHLSHNKPSLNYWKENKILRRTVEPSITPPVLSFSDAKVVLNTRRYEAKIEDLLRRFHLNLILHTYFFLN